MEKKLKEANALLDRALEIIKSIVEAQSCEHKFIYQEGTQDPQVFKCKCGAIKKE